MQPDFDQEVLTRLPLADATLSLWQWACADDDLRDLYDRHRGGCYDKKIPFPLLAQLIRDALLRHRGSGRQSFQRSREGGQLPTALSSAYDKLGRLPLAVSEALLAEGTDRLRQVAPPRRDPPVPASLRAFEVIVLDGKAIKRVAKRLKPLRGRKGGVLGGKALAALHLGSGLVVAAATRADGEVNGAKLVPDLLPAVRQRLPGGRLWVADRQFADLTQPAAFAAEGDHFLVRYSAKTHFVPDPARAAAVGPDRRGRAYRQEGGWLGRDGNARRRYVRRITLERPGEEAVRVLTDLLGAEAYPADDLLELYLARWQIERVFQQITEVFHLRALIGTSPEGTVFQCAFCLLLYNMMQRVKGYVAQAQQRAPEALSTELLFQDVHEERVALHRVLGAGTARGLVRPAGSAAQVRAWLGRRLGGVWTARWLKAPPKKRKPPTQKTSKRDHTPVFRILAEERRKNKESKSTS